MNCAVYKRIATFAGMGIVLFSCGEETTGPAYVNPDYPSVLVDSIRIGPDGKDVCIAPGTDLIYVSSTNNNEIFVLSADSEYPVDTIPLANPPGYLDATPDGRFVYATSWPLAEVNVIDTGLNELVCTIPVDTGPMAIEMAITGEFVFVACMDNKSVHVIRTSDNTTAAVFTFEWSPTCLEVLPNGEYIYAGNMAKKEIQAIRISDLTLISPIRTEEYPKIMTSTADSRYMFVFNKSSFDPRYNVVRLSDGECIANIRTRRNYIAETRIPNTNTAILVRNNDDRISVLNMDNYVFAPTVAAGPGTVACAISTDGQTLYLLDGMRNYLYIYE